MDENKNYIDYIVEHIDRNIKYSEYLTDNIDRNAEWMYDYTKSHGTSGNLGTVGATGYNGPTGMSGTSGNHSFMSTGSTWMNDFPYDQQQPTTNWSITGNNETHTKITIPIKKTFISKIIKIIVEWNDI